MKVQKGGIVLISFILSVLSHGGVELLPGGLLVGEVLQWSKDYWSYVKTGHHLSSKLSEKFGDTCYKEKKYTNAIAGRVVQAIPQISTQLAGISGIMNERSSNWEEQMKALKLDIVINNRLTQLIDKMDAVDSIYDELTESILQQKIMEYNGTSQCAFAYRQLDGNPLVSQLDAIYKIVVPSQQLLIAESWLAAIVEKLKPHQDALCNTGHSALDYLHSIYASLIMVEIKAYVMIAFSHNLLHNFNGDGPLCIYGRNPDDEMVQAQKKLYKHVSDYNRIFLQYMDGAGREFRACDRGSDYIRDETFFEMEGAIQMILHFPAFWEKGLVNREFPGHRCIDFPRGSKASDLYCDKKVGFCTTPMARNCLGYNDGCEVVNNKAAGCLAPKNSSRRYEWVEESDYFSVRYHYDCPENRALSLWKFYPRYQACFCRCVDNAVNSQSTHLFNLQWVESDVSENMVITGIRFIVKYRVMQFQIQQGRLGPHFTIEENHWKPVEDISEAIHAARLNKKFRGKWPDLIEDRDYLILSSKHRVHFDTLNVSHPNVLTGVRFYSVPADDPERRAIEISIKGTEFDHKTGKLCDECLEEIVTSKIKHPFWHYPNPFNPMWPRFPTIPVTSPGGFVDFTESHNTYDSGQTTLPLFDALPLVSSPPAPLGGLGIFHKGSIDFTGFVSLKFLSLDYPMYMKNVSIENE